VIKGAADAMMRRGQLDDRKLFIFEVEVVVSTIPVLYITTLYYQYIIIIHGSST